MPVGSYKGSLIHQARGSRPEVAMSQARCVASGITACHYDDEVEIAGLTGGKGEALPWQMLDFQVLLIKERVHSLALMHAQAAVKLKPRGGVNTQRPGQRPDLPVNHL